MKYLERTDEEFKSFMRSDGLLNNVENWEQAAEVVLSAAAFCESRRMLRIRMDSEQVVSSCEFGEKPPYPSLLGRLLAAPLASLFECVVIWLYSEEEDKKCFAGFSGENGDAEIAAWSHDYLSAKIAVFTSGCWPEMHPFNSLTEYSPKVKCALDIARYLNKCIADREVIRKELCADEYKGILKAREGLKAFQSLM